MIVYISLDKKAYTTDNALCPIMCIYIYRTTECMYDTVVYIAISIHIWHQYKYINLAIWKAPLKNFTKGYSMFIHIFWGWIQWGPCENYIATISIIMWIGATLHTSTFCKSMKKYVNLIHLFTFLLSAIWIYLSFYSPSETILLFHHCVTTCHFNYSNRTIST